jgi:hypothetical protein
MFVTLSYWGAIRAVVGLKKMMVKSKKFDRRDGEICAAKVTKF